MNSKIQSVVNEIKKNIKGKDDIIVKVLCAMFAGGHILLEDIPGVGKTTLALSISEALSMSYHRVQFTPDVMPSDITGFNMYNAQTQEFEFHDGAAMCNLLLADEINRTSPKTQSALLELMEEGKVTVDGKTHYLPKPFVVIATQNPFGSAGTQRLPESQMDRFMVRLSMGYPSHESAKDILRQDSLGEMIHPVISQEEFLGMQEQAHNVFVDEAIYEMIVNLTEATRNSESIQLGLSPRGSKALLRMAKAHAFLNDRNFVSPEDVVANLDCVITHRIVLSSRAKAKNIDSETILRKLADTVFVPKL